MLSKELSERIEASVKTLYGKGEPVKPKAIRAELDLDEEQWKINKQGIKDEAQRVLNEMAASPPAKSSTSEKAEQRDKPSSSKKTKYEKAADKNLNVFMQAVAGPLLGGLSGGDEADIEEDAGVSEDLDYDDEDEEFDVSSTSKKSKKAAVDKDKKKTAAAKKKAGKSKVTYKSAEYIEDSDDDAPAAMAAQSGSEDEEGEPVAESSKKPKKSKKPSKDKSSDGKKEKQQKKVSKAGEHQGTEAEEAEIKRLKGLLSVANGPRPFDRSTGAEKTLTVDQRLTRLKKLLADLGLTPKSSLNKAKELGELRALSKEVKELEGVPHVEGMRGGKKRKSAGVEEDGDDDDDAEKPPAKKTAKNFAAFLGDQGSDSE